MKQLRMGLIEIRADSESEWREWGARLMSEMNEEAIKSLTEEELAQETMSLVRIEGRLYLCYLADGKGMPANLKREVNKLHKDLLERTRIQKTEAEILYDLRR